MLAIRVDGENPWVPNALVSEVPGASCCAVCFGAAGLGAGLSSALLGLMEQVLPVLGVLLTSAQVGMRGRKIIFLQAVM